MGREGGGLWRGCRSESLSPLSLPIARLELTWPAKLTPSCNILLGTRERAGRAKVSKSGTGLGTRPHSFGHLGHPPSQTDLIGVPTGKANEVFFR